MTARLMHRTAEGTKGKCSSWRGDSDDNGYVQGADMDEDGDLKLAPKNCLV